MEDRFFAYGTLLCGDILCAVAGRRFPVAPGRVRGFRRNRLRGEVYPGIAPSPDGTVDGVVCRGLTAEDWGRLDRFEGEMYCKRLVSVELEGGEVVSALAYVLKPEFESRLGSDPWSIEEFLRSGKARFESHYRGFSDMDREAPGKGRKHGRE